MKIPEVLPFTFGMEVEYNGGSCDCCEGRGEVYCHECDGDGEVECGHCGHTAECTECYGNGEMECPECDGEGSGASTSYAPQGWDVKPEHCGTEYVSPPMRDVPQAMAQLRRLASNYSSFEVDNCGFHIHLSIKPTDPVAVDPVRFFQKWQELKEQRIYPLVPKGVTERHHTQWCMLVGEHTTFQDWQRSFQRYQEINPVSVSAHGTLEVRLGGSSADGEELCRFLEAVLELANECRYRNADPMARVRYLQGWAPSDSPLGQYAAGIHRRIVRQRRAAMQAA